jgi:hypothetical protein
MVEDVAAFVAMLKAERAKKKHEAKLRHRKTYREKNKKDIQERERIRARIDRAQKPDAYRKKNRDWYRMKHYGISAEEVDALFLSQGSRCAICQSPEPTGTRNWHVDHCHKTKKIRGILCQNCNWCLGYAKEDPEVLERMAFYIRSHQ